MRNIFKAKSKNRQRGRHKKKRKFFWHHMQEWLWPSMGLSAFARLQELKLKRQQDTAHKVALGFAVGVVTAFIPIFGQAIVAVGLAFLCRANILAAAVGSLLGNVWTFPILWIWSYKLGHLILHSTNPAPLPHPDKVLLMLIHPVEYFDIYHLPMLVGAVPSAIFAALITYALVYVNIKSYQKARGIFLAKRRQHHAEHFTKNHTLAPRHKPTTRRNNR